MGPKSSSKELQFELKYCERCGGLWMRPVGGGQIYCRVCGRAMAELPPASYQAETARMQRGPRWGLGGGGEFEEEEAYLEGEGYGDEEMDLENGGVA